MIRLQIQVTEQQLESLRREAERHEVSQSEIVRRSLDAFLGGHLPPDRAVVRERARMAIGAISVGPADVARRHDHYLAESAYDWREDE